MNNINLYEVNEELNSIIKSATDNIKYHIDGNIIVDCKKLMTKSINEMEMVCKKYGVDVTEMDITTPFGGAHIKAMKSISDKLTSKTIFTRRLNNAAANYLNAIFMKEV